MKAIFEPCNAFENKRSNGIIIDVSWDNINPMITNTTYNVT